MDETSRIFKRNVRAAIAADDRSQTAIALDAGLTQPQLSHILSGDRSVTLRVAASIAGGLGVNLGELVQQNERANGAKRKRPASKRKRQPAR